MKMTVIKYTSENMTESLKHVDLHESDIKQIIEGKEDDLEKDLKVKEDLKLEETLDDEEFLFDFDDIDD